MGDCSLVPFAPGHEARTTATLWGCCMLFDFRASGNCVNTRPLICVSHVVTWSSWMRCLPQLVSSVCIVYDTVTSDAVLV